MCLLWIMVTGFWESALKYAKSNDPIFCLFVLPNDKPVRGEQHCQSFYTQPTDSLSQLIPMENPGEKFATNRILWVSTFFLQISHADFFLCLYRHFQEINGEIRYFHD